MSTIQVNNIHPSGSNAITLSSSVGIDVSGSMDITGNLTVLGTTTTVDTVNMVIEDPLIVLQKTPLEHQP